MGYASHLSSVASCLWCKRLWCALVLGERKEDNRCRRQANPTARASGTAASGSTSRKHCVRPAEGGLDLLRTSASPTLDEPAKARTPRTGPRGARGAKYCSSSPISLIFSGAILMVLR